MTAFYKDGVCGQHNRHPMLMKAHGRIVALYEYHKEDMYVTCIADGNHSYGSFHYIYRAEDFRYGQATPKEI